MCAGAVQAYHEVFLPVAGPEQSQVRRREAGGAKALRERLRGRRDVAGRIARVDLDQLLEDVVGEWPEAISPFSAVEVLSKLFEKT